MAANTKEISKREDAFASLQNYWKRMMEDSFFDFPARFHGWEFPTLLKETEGFFSPRIDVEESETEMTVTAEIPGADEKDLNVSVTDNVLTIKGEKKSEKEEKDKNFHRTERHYGSFRRVVSLPAKADESKVNATFKAGVLTVKLPKTAEAQKSTKVQVKAG